VTTTYLAYIPSPSQGVWHLGPVPLRAYALFIIVGIVVALILGDRRWVARGGQAGVIYDIALWAVPFGLIGGRLYHVMTDWRTYFGDDGAGLAGALRIWDGGLGIWGAVALGGIGAWIGCRQKGIPLTAFGDAIAPGIVLAQAIGRLGNYFNQELYGRPTTLPWGLEIFERRDANGALDTLNGVSTGQLIEVVHPTFLYELLWNLLVFAALIYIDRRLKIGHGRLFATYVALYCVGRFWVELMRSDVATHIAGIRINSFTSTFVFVGAAVYIMVAPSGREDPASLAGKPEAVEDSVPLSVKEVAAVAATTGVVAAAKAAGDVEDEDAKAVGDVEDAKPDVGPPEADEPVADAAVADEVTDESAEDAAAEEPAEEPVADEVASEDEASDESVDEDVADEAVADEVASEGEAVADEDVADEAVADEVASEDEAPEEGETEAADEVTDESPAEPSAEEPSAEESTAEEGEAEAADEVTDASLERSEDAEPAEEPEDDQSAVADAVLADEDGAAGVQEAESGPELRPESDEPELRPEADEAEPETQADEAELETEADDAEPETQADEAEPETEADEAEPETEADEAEPETEAAGAAVEESTAEPTAEQAEAVVDEADAATDDEPKTGVLKEAKVDAEPAELPKARTTAEEYGGRLSRWLRRDR
jgi:prolipoprotein diacylglyceryl transferase